MGLFLYFTIYCVTSRLPSSHGLNVEVYHYATFNNQSSGSSEGKHAASEMKNLDLDADTLIFADMEDASTKKASVGDGIEAFWSALSAAGYNNHGVYLSPSYAYFNQVVATVGTKRVWLAQYPYAGYETKYESNWSAAGHGGWQFSSTGYLPGYKNEGPIDVDHDFDGLLTDGSVSSDNFANIESVKITGNTVEVKGWHVAKNSTVETHAYVIMYDATSKQEIARVAYTPLRRDDVAKVYSYVPNADYSGFDVKLTIPTGYDFAGKNIQFVLRYSDDADGNGNYTDVWSKDYNFSDNAGNLDSYYLDSNNTLHVSGWHAADASTALSNAYLIVYDDTTHEEITRVKYTPISRSDVAKSQYGDIYNSEKSGFDQTIDLKENVSSLKGHQIQIVMRYSSDAKHGEGTRIDYWSDKKII